MKIRKGFISNSSSTSFVLGLKETDDTLKMNLEVEINVSSLQKLTKNNIDELYDEGLGIIDEEEKDKCLELLENGYNIYEFRISSEDFDNPIGLFLYYNGLNDKNIKILNEGHYIILGDLSY